MADNDRHENVRPGERGLEIEVTADDVVRLWVDRNRKDTSGCLSALDRLLRQRSRRGARYRFLGACRDRRAGVDCVCVSFRLVDGNGRGAGPAAT